MDIAHLVNWEFDVASGMFTFDERFYALYGSNADREGGNLMSAETYMQQFVSPEDRQNVLAEIQKLLVTKDPAYTGQMEHRIISGTVVSGRLLHDMRRSSVLTEPLSGHTGQTRILQNVNRWRMRSKSQDTGWLISSTSFPTQPL